MMMNAANKKTDKSLSDFQTGISRAAYAILETVQLIFDTRTAIVDSILLYKVLRRGYSSLINTWITHQDSWYSGGALLKQVYNKLLFLTYLFNFASRQCHELLGLHFSLLHSFKDTLLASKTCYYGHVNWILPQAQQQPSSGCQRLQLMQKVANPSSKLGSSLDFKSSLHWILVVHLQWRSLT